VTDCKPYTSTYNIRAKLNTSKKKIVMYNRLLSSFTLFNDISLKDYLFNSDCTFNYFFSLMKSETQHRIRYDKW